MSSQPLGVLMSDRTFVLAMWNAGAREWDDAFALEWVLTSAESFSRGISAARTHLLVVREVREAQRRYEQLRLDGTSPSVALANMALHHDQDSGRHGPPAGDRGSGSAATRP